MSQSARLQLLGGLRLEREGVLGGAPVQRKRLALLAIVARAGAGGVSRDRLLALLWPDQSPEDARHALDVALSALRRALPDGALVGVPLGVALDAVRLPVDAAEFETALARRDWTGAVACYRGPFLDGVTLPGAPEFERWAEEERSVLARRHVDALAAATREAADASAAVRWARAWAAADPLGARAATALVEALAAAGDLTAAARAAQTHGSLVRQELGMAPDPSVAEALDRASRMAHAPHAPHAHAATVRDTPEDVPYTRAVGSSPLAVGAGDAAPGATDGGRVISDLTPLLTRSTSRWTRGRVVLGIALGAGGIALAAKALTASRPDDVPLAERRVVVAPFLNETGDTTLAPLGRMAADWVAQGLATTGVADVVPTSAAFAAARYADSLAARGGDDRIRVLATETGARLVVSGGVYRVADSLQLRAVFADGRDGRPIRALEPVTAPAASPVAVVDLLRRRVLGALAPLLDERLATTAARVGAPPSYEAYREFSEGMRAVTRNDFRAALPRFERAYALDTTYATALLSVALSHANLGRWAVADSVARVVDRSRERLTPYDAAMLDAVRAWGDHDWAAAYDAAVRGARAAPGSIAAAQVGLEALRLNRPGEAARVLERLDPTRGELRGYLAYWSVLTDAYHLLGRYDDELRVARTSRSTDPGHPGFVGTEARALAALGRPTEALALIDTRLAMSWKRGPPPEAMMLALARELRAHGHHDAAADAWHHVLSWLDARDAETRESRGCRSCRGQALAGLGRLAEARAIFAALAEEDTARAIGLRDLGVTAARSGDRATAERAAARIAARRGRDEPTYVHWRAQIAAQLGDRAGATALLREAIGRGLPFTLNVFHAAPELEPLRDYPPFRALVQPKE